MIMSSDYETCCVVVLVFKVLHYAIYVIEHWNLKKYVLKEEYQQVFIVCPNIFKTVHVFGCLKPDCCFLDRDIFASMCCTALSGRRRKQEMKAKNVKLKRDHSQQSLLLHFHYAKQCLEGCISKDILANHFVHNVCLLCL